MCDTLVVLPHATQDGRLIFAKNSDRSPNEPHIVASYPAKDIDLSSSPQVKLTYISIPQVQHTHSVVLLKPSWMWGAEMGFNEFGLNIGNEAVFTKEKRNTPPALTGMDMLRLALERTRDATSALQLIISLLQEYGQGGNCGYDHNFYYHNSFLIADRSRAYVLETAGKNYATKEVKDYYAISNCLSINSDYQSIYSASNKKLNFDKHYTDQIFTYFAQSRTRRAYATQILSQNAGRITVQTVMEILRGHNPNKKENAASVGSICMHAGGLIGDHTTGSYVAVLGGQADEYYITAASSPCQSVFKPFISGNTLPPSLYSEAQGRKLWYKSERLMRYIISGQADKQAYIADCRSLEQKHIKEFALAKDIRTKESIMLAAWAESEQLIDRYLTPLQKEEYQFRLGTKSYRRYWAKKTAAMLADIAKLDA